PTQWRPTGDRRWRRPARGAGRLHGPVGATARGRATPSCGFLSRELGQKLVELLASGAKPRVDGEHRDLQDLTDLTAGELFDLVQDEHLALAVAHPLEHPVEQGEPLRPMDLP